MNSLLASRYVEKVIISKDSKKHFGEKVIIIDKLVEIQGGDVSMNVFIDYDLSKLDGEHFCNHKSSYRDIF